MIDRSKLVDRLVTTCRQAAMRHSQEWNTSLSIHIHDVFIDRCESLRTMYYFTDDDDDDLLRRWDLPYWLWPIVRKQLRIIETLYALE